MVKVRGAILVLACSILVKFIKLRKLNNDPPRIYPPISDFVFSSFDLKSKNFIVSLAPLIIVPFLWRYYHITLLIFVKLFVITLDYRTYFFTFYYLF